MRLIDADAFIEKLAHAPMVQEAIKKAMDTMPTVEAPTWIPCSERLPKNDDYVIVTILDEQGDTSYRYTDFGWYLDAAKCWIVASEQRIDVIAWMPLPRAFKERV